MDLTLYLRRRGGCGGVGESVMVREGRVLRRVPAQLQEVMDQLVRQSL